MHANPPPQLCLVETCDYCGSPRKAAVYPEWDMVRCVDCGLVYMDRRCREEDVAQIYSEHYFHSHDSQWLGYDDYLGEKENIGRTCRRRLREIERRLGQSRGRLLDVGCATGFFLDVARTTGWEVQGVEVSAYAARRAREELGLEVHQGFLTGLPTPASPFDLVTMWDYVEHTLWPTRDFRVCADILRPGGLLVLTTPDMDSWPARLFGPRWMGIKPHEHYFYFSRRTLRVCLEAAGFDVEAIHTVGKFVSLGFFIKRVGHYSPPLARLLRLPVAALGWTEKSVYVDPRDLVVAFARRR